MDSEQQTSREERSKLISNLQLLNACEDGRVDVVRDLLNNEGACLNFCDTKGDTPLHCAVRGAVKEVITDLIGRPEIQLSVENALQKTPLDLAWDSVEKASENEVKHLKAQAALLPFKSRILKEAKCIVDAHKNQSQERHMSPLPYYEAVLNGHNDPTLSEEELVTVLSFFCPVWDGHSQVLISITTLQLVHDAIQEVALLRTKEGFFFSTELKTFANTAVRTLTSKSTTEALLKVKHICASLRKAEDKKLMEELETLNIDKNSIDEAHKLFANVLHEIASTKSKITSIQKFLVEEQKLAETKFTYRSANVLIFFLETFAMKGIDPRLPLASAVQTKLTQDKKKYFKRYFPKTDNPKTDYLKIFSQVRSAFVKKVKKISPKHLDDFILKEKISMKQLMDSLLDFSEQVMSLPNEQEMKELREESRDVFKKIRNLENFFKGMKDSAQNSESAIKQFCEKVKKMLDGESQLRDELIFELLVNIIPILDTPQGTMKPYIYRLRNSVIHSLGETGEKYMESFVLAMHDYYRFELARKIHDILVNFRAPNEQEALEKELNAALESVEENFQDITFSLPKDIKSDYSEYSGNCLWTEQNEDGIIYTYVRYMAPIFDRYMDDENDDDYREIQIDLSDAQKMNIFEALWHLSLDPVQTNKDEEAFNILRKLPLSESQVQLLNAKPPGSGDEVLKKEVKEIMYNLRFLSSKLALKRKVFTHDDLIILFTAFTKNKGGFSFNNHKHLLDQLELSQDEKKCIENCLNSFPDVQSSRKMVETSVQVNISSIVLSLLKLIYCRYKEYQLKIKSISSAYSDETFITYLVSHDIEKKSDGKSKLLDKFRTYKVLKDIRRLKFTVPYIATLLAEIQSIDVIEWDHLQSLLAALMKGNMPIQYLEGLLRFRDQHVLKASCTILREEDLSDEGMQAFFRALCRSAVLKRTLDCVKEELNNVKYQEKSQRSSIQRKILSAANVVVLEYINLDQLDLAQDILSCVKKFTKDSTDGVFQQEYEECYLLEAKVKILKGRRVCDGKHGTTTSSCEGKECFEQAIKLLNIFESGESSHSGQLMLALSRKGYAYYLLGRCTREPVTTDNLDACHLKLWKTLWEYVSLSKEAPPEFEVFYHRAMMSARYRTLMTNMEYEKYLSIQNVKSAFTWYSFSRHTKNIDLIGKDLQSWKELYVTIPKYEQISESYRDQLQKYQAYAHFDLALQYYHNDWFGNEYEYHWLKAMELRILRYNRINSRFGPFSHLLKREVMSLKEALEEKNLSGRRNEAEYENRNTLYIRGVPELQNENCFKIIQDLGRHIELVVEKEHIISAQRIEHSESNNNPIVVTFAEGGICQRFKIARRKFKNLNAKNIGFEENSKIFMNMKLTQAGRNLFNKAIAYFKPQGCIVRTDDKGMIYVSKKGKENEKREYKRYFIDSEEDFVTVTEQLDN